MAAETEMTLVAARKKKLSRMHPHPPRAPLGCGLHSVRMGRYGSSSATVLTPVLCILHTHDPYSLYYTTFPPYSLYITLLPPVHYTLLTLVHYAFI